MGNRVPRPGPGGSLAHGSLRSGGGEGARIAKLTATDKKLCQSHASVPHMGSTNQEHPWEGG